MGPEARRRLEWIGHALLGAVFVLKGYAKAEHWPEHAFFVVLFIGAGLLVFAGTIAHARLGHRFPHLEALFALLEAAVLAGVTWLHFEAGKTYLPWVTGATTLGLLALAAYRFRHPLAHGPS